MEKRLTLRALTLDMFHACIALRVAPEQERFVASNVYSVAESALRPDTWPLAAFNGDEMVGFVMISREPDTGRVWIMRLMIAAEQQGRGFGRTALEAAVSWIVDRYQCQEIYLGVDDDNSVAQRLYRNYGFHPTGEIDHSEIVMRLSIPQRIVERRI